MEFPMKNIFFASLVAVLGLGVQSFAQDDDYAQDQDDQVEYATKTASYDTEEDDGYGNPVQPQEEPAAVRTETQAQSSNSSSGNPFFDKTFNLAWRLGIGFNGLHDTPEASEYNKLGAKDPNDGWAGANVELGLFSQIHINPMFSIVPELQFTFRFLSQTQDEYYLWGYGYVKEELNLYIFDLDIPVTFRFNPVHFFYVEAGAQLAFNLGCGSDYTLSNDDGKELASADTDFDWSSESMFISLVFGLGATFEMHNKNYDVGLRVVYDLTNLHKDNKDLVYPENATATTQPAVIENNSKVWAIQLVIGYWFL